MNAHSLFSKWFSESGKMVQGMFARITELLEDGDALVCVLIDEVESRTGHCTVNAVGLPSFGTRTSEKMALRVDRPSTHTVTSKQFQIEKHVKRLMAS